eukprot:GFUD01028750.1.p1 GENE.GFUD01028750.1~~GFUD01028750.1.p1  ORF type:complete len:1371 (+),score=452.05 GFUD01028750.1:48-4160(+)
MVGKGKKLLGSPSDHFKQLLSNLSTLQSSDRFTDVIFQCSGGQVNAHKAMLIPLSPLLEFLFEVSSSKQASDVTVISLADVDVGPVMRMISYIYKGNLDNSDVEERCLIQQILDLLQINVDLVVVETSEPTTPSKTNKKTPKATTPTFEKVLLKEDYLKDDFSSTPRGKPKKGRAKKSDDVSMELEVDLITSEVSPKSPPRRLGGFRSFDNTQIQEAIMDNAKTRAEMDKMKVGLANVSKDKSKTVQKFYNSAMIDVNDQEFHENIVENPISLDDTDNTDDFFTTPRGRSLKQGKVDINQKSKEKDQKYERQPSNPLAETSIEIVDFDDEYEVEQVIDKRLLLGKEEYLVKWKGWEDIADRTWEPLDNLDGAKKLIIAFEKEQTEMKKMEPKKKTVMMEVNIIDDLLDDDYEVEKILDKRGKGRKVEYLVKWKTFEKVDDQTWEPLENLTESSEIVEAFEKELEVKNESEIIDEPEDPPSFKKTSKRGRSRESPIIAAELDIQVVSPKRNSTKSVTSKVKDEVPKKVKDDVIIDDLLDDDYEVEQILDKRGKGRRVEYLVKWKTFDKVEDQTWEPLENLTESSEIVEAFEKELEAENESRILSEPEITPSFKKASKRGRSRESPIIPAEVAVDIQVVSPKRRNSTKSVTSKVKDEVPKNREGKDDEIIDDLLDDDYEVEKILDKRCKGRKIEYLVKWKNFVKVEEQTWEPLENLTESSEIVDAFEEELVVKDKKNSQLPKENEIPTEFKKSSKRGKSKSAGKETTIRSSDSIEADDEYEVEHILEVRKGNLGKEYLVKWKGWENEEDRTWEPEASLEGSKKLLKEFDIEEAKKLRKNVDSSCSREMKNETIDVSGVKLNGSKNLEDSLANKSNNTSVHSEDLPLSTFQKLNKRGRKSKDVEGLKIDNLKDNKSEENGGGEYEVEKILDHQEENGVVQYLVKWKNWDNEEDNTWEPSANLTGSEDIIDKYEKMLKEKKENVIISLPTNGSSKKKKKEEELFVSDDEDVVEYEVQLILEKRMINGVDEYLVKWKGWEDVGDRTWEPEGNLQGSEKLIKKFESGLKTSQTKLKKKSTEDGVVLCVVCNRIFLSCAALKSHEMEHKKPVVTPKIKKVVSEVADETEEVVDIKKDAKRKRTDSGDVENLTCYNCGLESKSRSDLKNHVLTHFYADFYAKLPASKPFTCPTCDLESRDKITLVRHFAFAHKEIYKFCTHEQLTNSTAEDPIVDENDEEVNGSPHQSPKYKPGPKSKKSKLVPFSDETLVSDESSPNKVRAIKRASDKNKVDLTDSSDDEDHPIKTTIGEIKSFDDLFCESPVTSKKANDVAKIVFNKDSDEESDHEKALADVDDLMGGSDDEKSKVGDDVWDLENV